MNIRLQKYKKNRLSGMSQQNAAIAAGFSASYAKSHGKDLEQRAKMGDVLERHGITDKRLAEKHSELLEASTDVFSRRKDGSVENVGEEENLPVQLKALELAYKVKQHFVDSPLTEVHNHFTLTSPPSESRVQKLEL